MKIKIFRTIILSEVLCGLETWSLMWQEEHRLRVFENRVLRRIFGLERDEITGEWRRLHIEELYDLYSSPNTIREKNEMGVACSTYWRQKRCKQGFDGDIQGKETTRKTQNLMGR